jgi:enterochelin esterase-like enzyme
MAGGLLVAFLLIAASSVLWCGIKHGRFETIEYDFPEALSHKQRIVVYLPPNYPRDAPYSVLYLLHGAGDDENGWQEQGAIGSLLDRLYAEKKIVPMIVVMPNAQGRSGVFEHDLLEKVIPYVESHYVARGDAQHRAIAGSSLGAWQALGIGLRHPDRFAWVGGFSPAMEDVLPAHYSGRLKLLWLSTGDRDQCKILDESLHRTLETGGIPHVWRVLPGEHDWPLWKENLRQFTPLLFHRQ